MALIHIDLVGNPAHACKYLTISLVEGNLYTLFTDYLNFLGSTVYGAFFFGLDASSGILHIPLASLYPLMNASLLTIILRSMLS